MAEIELHDASSVTGANVSGMVKEFGINPRLITPQQMGMLYRQNIALIHREEEWKLPLLDQMLAERQVRLEEGED